MEFAIHIVEVNSYLSFTSCASTQALRSSLDYVRLNIPPVRPTEK